MFRRANLLCFTKSYRFYSNTNGFKEATSKTSLILGSTLLFGSGLVAGGYVKSKQLASSPSENLFPLSSITPLESLNSPEFGTKKDFTTAFEEIKAVIGGDHVSTDSGVLADHSDTYWNTHHAAPGQKPFAVVFPGSTEEVSEIMKICSKYKVPVVPFSGGTSLEGHFIPVRGGISVDLNRMNQVLAIHDSDLDAVVQPGVPWEDLGDTLSEKGLMFGCDPGPTAEIGGMVATSCSGTNAARYGTMKDNVLGLTVVLPDGTVVKTRKRPRKSSAGYNLTNLFVGSEGTLGIVTEVTLKLHVKPLHESIAAVSFDTVEDAANSVEEIVGHGIQVNAVELMDDRMMNCINLAGLTTRKWHEKPTLFFKLGGGTKPLVDELIKSVRAITTKNHSKTFEFAHDDDEKLELWQARKVALWSTIDYGRTKDPDIQLWTTDVAVPVSKLSAVLKETQADIRDSGLTATMVGHVGDGNFHAFLLYTKSERKTAEDLVDKMVKRALSYEGTCTGEHGVGFGKREYLREELGEDTVSLMRKIKMAIDPLRIMNTDKVLHIDPNEKYDNH